MQEKLYQICSELQIENIEECLEFIYEKIKLLKTIIPILKTSISKS